MAISAAASGTASAQWAPWLADSLASLTRAPGTVTAVVVLDPRSGRRVAVRPDERFHAASTMKVPVLLELARRVDAGDMRWTDSITVENRFASIADGSPYTLDPADDSDSTMYALVGRNVAIRQLAERMVVRSSNLATNLLIGRLGAAAVQARARTLGATAIEVRRGVEDNAAFRAGLNNTTSAADLAALFAAIADGRAAGPATLAEVRRILLAQEFNDAIPAGLPAGTPVAHKTGEITGIVHDAALVLPPARAPYVLVVLTRGFATRDEGAAAIRAVSALVWRAITDRT